MCQNLHKCLHPVWKGKWFTEIVFWVMSLILISNKEMKIIYRNQGQRMGKHVLFCSSLLPEKLK